MTFIIQQTLLYAVPLMIVALAGVFAERSGIINLALEGIMIFGAFIGVLFVRSVQEETSFAPDAGEDDLTIAKVKSFYFKPMTREEAVMQMNLLNHDFFAFRDEDNGGTFAVVYRRGDGGYGLIDDVE